MSVEQIDLINNPEELIRLNSWLNRVCDQYKLADNVSYYLELVIEEAVTNIFKYAFDNDKDHLLSIMVNLIPDKIVVRIKDDGFPFNPLSHQADKPESLENAKVGGLGILLIKKFTSDLKYNREDGKNCLTMVLDRA